MIKWLLIICSCLLLQSDEVTITWSEDQKLTWNDFKDKPNPNIDAVALTASGITFGYSISRSETEVFSFKTSVHSHFYPEKSWYKNSTADTYILGHEQLHFDITELHARKFRKRIEALKLNNNIKIELDKLHDVINKELAAMQDLYDDKTDYSRKPKEQLQWQKFIQEELKKLEAYKSKDNT